mmetsp:Transcript_13030/g.19764  ORF Transcript_13030/g.19764 Transcript_13030/m.19764 type:complete len:260 (-) Transcript_13030:60-839(-)
MTANDSHTDSTTTNEPINNRQLFTSSATHGNGSNTTKIKLKMSKLKQRKAAAKEKLKQAKYEHIRTQKKMQSSNQQISTNCMYPECVPLSDEELHLIEQRVMNVNVAQLCASSDFGKENDEGCVEHKWKLVSPNADRIHHLVTQMKYRLNEGQGTCVYHVGVADDGQPTGLDPTQLIETIKTVFRLNRQLNGTIEIVSIQKGMNGNIATLHITNECTATTIQSPNLANHAKTSHDHIKYCNEDQKDSHDSMIKGTSPAK